jgi:hypothetical protein
MNVDNQLKRKLSFKLSKDFRMHFTNFLFPIDVLITFTKQPITNS